MSDSFSFRIARELDVLVYSKDDVKRERRKRVRTSLSSRSSSSLMSSSHSEFDRSLPDFDNPAYLEMQRRRLSDEIEALETELAPLRETYADLLDAEQSCKYGKIRYKRRGASEFDVYDRIPKQGVTASDLMQLQRELREVTEELRGKRLMMRKKFMEAIEDEIRNGTREVYRIYEACEQHKEEETRYRGQAEKYRLSAVYDDVQEQKEHIQDMREMLTEEVEKHRALKAAYLALKERKELSRSQIESSHEIVNLKARLERARKSFKNAKNRYIAIRNGQIDEYQTLQQMILNTADNEAVSSSSSEEIADVPQQQPETVPSTPEEPMSSEHEDVTDHSGQEEEPIVEAAVIAPDPMPQEREVAVEAPPAIVNEGEDGHSKIVIGYFTHEVSPAEVESIAWKYGEIDHIEVRQDPDKRYSAVVSFTSPVSAKTAVTEASKEHRAFQVNEYESTQSEVIMASDDEEPLPLPNLVTRVDDSENEIQAQSPASPRRKHVK